MCHNVPSEKYSQRSRSEFKDSGSDQAIYLLAVIGERLFLTIRIDIGIQRLPSISHKQEKNLMICDYLSHQESHLLFPVR